MNDWLTQILSNKESTICIMGDTLNPDKYAYKIKQSLVDRGYQNLYCVDKEITSLDQLPSHIDLMILCMNPLKAEKLLSSACNHIDNVLIQPGANSDAITQLLSKHKITFYDGCILVYWSLQKAS